nr:hypothetical protein [Cyanidioschyzonaceae sp. 2]
MKLLHTIEEVVYLEHTDAAGVMYFASLVAFAHRAFERLLADKGLPLRLMMQRYTLPIVHLQAEYYLPCYAGDELTISVYLQNAANRSLRLHYRILKNRKMVANLSMIHVCVSKGRTKVLPDDLLVCLGERDASEM